MAKILLSTEQWKAIHELTETACKSWFHCLTVHPGRNGTKIDYRVSRENIGLAFQDFTRETLAKGIRFGKLDLDAIVSLYELFVRHDLMSPEGREAFLESIRIIPVAPPVPAGGCSR